jgi:hypothetical protein
MTGQLPDVGRALIVIMGLYAVPIMGLFLVLTSQRH